MTNISALFNNILNPNERTATYSLSGHLEAIVRGYWVMGEGYDDVIRVYYNPEFDIETDVGFDFITQENLIAYVSLDHHYALVIDEKIEFDFKAFEYIDSGNKYLNPNHFSINQMMNYMNKKVLL
ncbi:MAG: hypothetical protein R3Y54_03940 [Eubacteriales bacterium]